MPTPLPIISRRFAAAFLVLGTLSACAKTASAPSVPANLIVVQGNFQSVQAGQQLPNAIVLRAVDATATAMAAVPVSLTVSDGGGTVTPASGVTDAKGEFTAKWTLGPTAAGNKLLAKVPGLDPVKIEAIGILPSDIVIAQGNSQTAKVGATLPTTIVARVVGGGNVPMAGITVYFQVTGGGGSIAPQTGVTNAFGEVTAKWTLGNAVGTQTANISSSVLTPVLLFATATP